MTHPRPVIDSQASLERTWRTLLNPLGFVRAALWLMAIDEQGDPHPQLLEIDEIAEAPTGKDRAQFADFLRMMHEDVVPEATRFAFVLARPGLAEITSRDRAWASVIYEACRQAGVTSEVVHLAADDDIRPVPLDEAGLARGA